MGLDDHNLDSDYFEAELRQRFPPPVGLIFEHYLHLDPRNGLNLVLPPSIAAYLVADHPRIPGSAQKGIRRQDGIMIWATDLSATELRSQIARFQQVRTVIFLETTPDGESAQMEKGVACCDALSSAGSADLIVPAEFISHAQAEPLRRLLLTKGAVTDLFDCGAYWYIGWLGNDEEPFDKTQVLRVPPRDEWQPQFVADLGESTLLWRWGDLVHLPHSGPWTWAHLPHDYVSRLKRLGAQLEAVDTATLSDVAAFLRISYIETGLRYLLHLRVGDNPEALWQLLDTTTGEQVRSRWESARRGEPHDFLDLRHFQQILKAGWSDFVNIFPVEGPDDGELLLSELRRGIHRVNEVRKVVMHPTQISQRVTDEDLQTLDALIQMLDAAITRAEDDDQVGDGLLE